MAKNVERKGPYTSGQMEALSALSDTLLPSVEASHSLDEQQKLHANYDSVLQFYRTSAPMAGTPPHLAVLLGVKIDHPKIYLSRIALSLLSTWIGTFILCGTKSMTNKFPFFLRFSQISRQKREQILLSWCNSWFSLLRVLYTALKLFTLLLFFTQVDENGENVSWKAIGYCGPDPDLKTPNSRTESAQKIANDQVKEETLEPLNKGIINMSLPRELVLNKLKNLGFPVSTPHSRTPRIQSLKPSFVVKCDVVVLGSGSGGGLVAGVLAKAGYKVLVLEKGMYFAKSNLSLLEGQALDQMYLENGISGTDGMDIIMLAGSTVGGGSMINWSASLRTPPHVRKEWSEKHKLELFDSKVYENALDVVCRKMGVQSEMQSEGFNNMVLRKGCESLGYPVENIPRNASSDHYCGWCHLGCKDGKKKGVTETWLVDLVESGNGAILPECQAVKVITQKKDGKKSAIGVAFAFKHQGWKEIAIVESRVTVVACGAICTPSVLKRSGLKNPNIGRNLHLHPVAMAWGYFPDHANDSWPEAEKKSYEGGIMTAMSKVVEDPDGSGYGVVIQTPALHPGMFAALTPWLSGQDIKNRMLKFSRTAHIFALTRDKGSGKVITPNNIRYDLEKSDRDNISNGVERVLRILAAAGAEEIGTQHVSGKVLNVKKCSKDEFERFVKEESLRPLKNLWWPMCSAHQMGSCRMGPDPKVSVVSPKGETWEVEGLFVADSSVFPTALGVNPMVTVQAIAYCTAQSILDALGAQGLV